MGFAGRILVFDCFYHWLAAALGLFFEGLFGFAGDAACAVEGGFGSCFVSAFFAFKRWHACSLVIFLLPPN